MKIRGASIVVFLFIMLIFVGCQYNHTPKDDPLDMVSQLQAIASAGEGNKSSAPFPVSSNPSNGDTGVRVDGIFSITFSEEMESSTITIQDSDGSCSGTMRISNDDFTTCLGGDLYTEDNISYELDLLNPLSEKTVYTWRLTDAITGKFNGTIHQIDIDFTTQSLPALVSSDPSDGDTGVSVDKNFILNFTEVMDRSSVYIQASDGACSRQVQVSADDFNTCLGGYINTDNGTSFTFQLKNTMNGLTDYRFRITDDARSLDGDVFKQTTISFTTQILAGSGSTNMESTGSDLTVTDNNTGLMWQKCSKGESGSDCSGTRDTAVTFSDAGTYCANLDLDGYTDWRLPEIWEWVFLINYFIHNEQRLNTDYFPDESSGYLYHSKTEAPVANYAWQINIDSGELSASDISGLDYPVRCVRGDTQPVASFSDNEDGTVSDSRYGLIWTRCGMGAGGNLNNGVDYACTTPDPIDWGDARYYCDALDFADRTNWRIPSVKEIFTVIDFTQSAVPMIDPAYFPYTITSAHPYWTSDLSQSDSDKYHTIDLEYVTLGTTLAANNSSVYTHCVADQ